MQNANLALQIEKPLTLCFQFPFCNFQFAMSFTLPPSPLQSAFFHQPLVVSGEHMGFNLLDGIQGHANHNQERGSSKIEGDIELCIENRRQDADGGDINRSSEGDSSEHLIDILSGLLARTDAGDITAEFLHIIGDIIWVEGNGRIKIAEEDDESHIEKIIEECAGS